MAYKNRVIVEIMGAEYAIISENPEDYVKETAAEVEKKIKTLINNNPRISIIMASNLACMDFSDEAKEAKKDAENLRSQINGYVNEINKLKTQLDYAKLEIDKLKKNIDTLNSVSPFGIGDNKARATKTKDSSAKNKENGQIGFFDTKK